MNSNITRGSGLIRVVEGLEKVIVPLTKRLAIIGAVLCMIMSIIISVDVALFRFLLNRPLSGTIEYEQFMLSVVVFLSVAYTMHQKGHVSVDILSTRFPPRVHSFVQNLLCILGVFFFSIMAVQNASRVKISYDIGEIGQVTGIPFWPFLIIVVVGCILVCLIIFIELFTNLDWMLKNLSRPWMSIFLSTGVSFFVITLPVLLRDIFAFEIGTLTSGVIGIFLMLVLMAIGFPIAFSMGIVGILGNWYLSGADTSFAIVRMLVFETSADYFFSIIPLFILMGFLCFTAGLSRNLYNAAYSWFGSLKGGLAIASVFACGGFAAICGDSLATAATMGTVALPEMKKFRYADSLATGCIAAGGTLGILIPPSMGFVIYGIITEQSVGKLFMAGLLPGILLSILFAVTIGIRTKLNPSLGPAGSRTTLSHKFNALKGVWGVIALFLLVIGGIYLGFFSPTEAGGIGATGALILTFLSKRFSWPKIMDGLLETGRMTAMIFVILIGVAILGYFIALSGIPLELSRFIVSLQTSRYIILALVLFLYLILGMLMNIIPMIMLTLPIIFPTIIALGFDPIWYGVVMVIMMEMGQITPPVGINVFVIYGVAKDVPMEKIFRGILPFLIAEVIILIILIIFPEIALLLPESMETLPDISK